MITMVPKPSNIQRTDLLIETDWLSRHLNDTDIRIIDLRSREEYDKAHIKNAVHLVFKDLGIDKNTLVIAYDDDSSHYAARLFWMEKKHER